MGDQERQDLAEQVQSLVAAFRQHCTELRENTGTTKTILKRLDGEVGGDGTVQGGLCELVKSHARFIDRRRKWEGMGWAALGACGSAIGLAIAEHLFK